MDMKLLSAVFIRGGKVRRMHASYVFIIIILGRQYTDYAQGVG